jgi:hypothetical protein
MEPGKVKKGGVNPPPTTPKPKFRHRGQRSNSEEVDAEVLDLSDLGLGEKVDVEKIDYNDIEGKFLLVKVGTIHDPAEDNDINNVEKQLNNIFDEAGVNCLLFVTHHALDIQVVK